MTSRPMLFSAPMVRAILEGRKTVTRRVVKPQPSGGWEFEMPPKLGRIIEPKRHPKADKFGVFLRCTVNKYTEVDIAVSPYGQPGDEIWVKETWMPFDVHGHDYHEPSVVIGYRASNDVRPNGVSHEDFGASRQFPCSPEEWRKFKSQMEMMEATKERWTPSIFMPRRFSRITLVVEDVRVERLQDITEEDAAKEGIESGQWGFKFYGKELERLNQWTTNAKWSFQSLWESINGPGSWDANPFVWRVQFRRA
jgi:hypothetical protein